MADYSPVWWSTHKPTGKEVFRGIPWETHSVPWTTMRLSLAAPVTWVMEDIRTSDALSGGFAPLVRARPSETATSVGGQAEVALWAAAVVPGTVLTPDQLGSVLAEHLGRWPKLRDVPADACMGSAPAPGGVSGIPWVSLGMVEPGQARVLAFAFEDTTTGMLFLGTAWMPEHPPTESVADVAAIIDSFVLESEQGR